MPVSIAGDDVYGGDSSATQNNDNSASSDASNSADTDQDAYQSQDSSSSCLVGCGGSGQAQALEQDSSTYQDADSEANAYQNGVNANVPVSIAGYDVYGGSSSADQSLSNYADSSASNDATTDQYADQSQSSSSSCLAGCGGSGQAQELGQFSSTDQYADSDANADQNGVNANVPVSIAGYDVYGGDSSATQYNDNSASSSASNDASTDQYADQSQDSSSSCAAGCGGSGQAQALIQESSTYQDADSEANAYQNGVNANVPVSIAGYDVYGGSSSADQSLSNYADSSASNDATTDQYADQSQSSSSSCLAGCGGSGQAQELGQFSSTDQYADSDANADQNGVNANVPVSIAGWDVYGGDSSATQNNDNSATSEASNTADTNQDAYQSQDSSSSCLVGCGGSGQAQALIQDSSTYQDADSEANAYQNGVNANAPVSVAGDDVYEGSSSADQSLSNSADSSASNDATTDQYADQSQSSSSSCGAGCGGSGQAQELGQFSSTEQYADSDANAYQNGVNTNAPVSIAGDDVDSGDSSATQYNDNSASSDASNTAETNQDGYQSQGSWSGCLAGCGGSGQAQALIQDSSTYQDAYSEANADQNGVNANVAVSIAGGDVYSG